ncbi:MAG: hypothetical protein MUE44_30810 [Oscillatoriaceae cyanobacterium Prado104]|jgi:hypothetical protein|nr:hypothetical protein [Oscillatoriaceae cyanobacterium Prado104]
MAVIYPPQLGKFAKLIVAECHMNQYPIILIPDPIVQAMNAVPLALNFTEPKPLPPSYKPQPIDVLRFFYKAIPIIIPFASITLIASRSIVITCYISVGGIFITAVNFWQQQMYYLRQLDRYEQEMRDYKSNLEGWKKRETQHKRQIAASQKPEKIKQYRYQIVKDIIIKTAPPEGRIVSTISQWIESKFYKILQQVFRDRIYSQLILQKSQSYQPYCIEISYFDKTTNLRIDIIIDTPYRDEIGEPENYEVLIQDNQRHQLFLEKGWIVVRFAEEQVVRWPQSCCRVIAEVINQIIGQPIPDTLTTVETLQPIQQWNEIEARQMAQVRYRDNYLTQR